MAAHRECSATGACLRAQSRSHSGTPCSSEQSMPARHNTHYVASFKLRAEPRLPVHMLRSLRVAACWCHAFSRARTPRKRHKGSHRHKHMGSTFVKRQGEQKPFRAIVRDGCCVHTENGAGGERCCCYPSRYRPKRPESSSLYVDVRQCRPTELARCVCACCCILVEKSRKNLGKPERCCIECQRQTCQPVKGPGVVQMLVSGLCLSLALNWLCSAAASKACMPADVTRGSTCALKHCRRPAL